METPADRGSLSATKHQLQPTNECQSQIHVGRTQELSGSHPWLISPFIPPYYKPEDTDAADFRVHAEKNDLFVHKQLPSMKHMLWLNECPVKPLTVCMRAINKRVWAHKVESNEFSTLKQF